MRSFLMLILISICQIGVMVAKPQKVDEKKRQVLTSVDIHQDELIKLSDQIWQFAETAYKEHKSATILADYAELKGFKVERGVADIPTAFVASYGSGKPVIGILGEFDALPGLSQKVQTTKEAVENGTSGHGCGHNLFGAGSLGAALAVKELIAEGKLEGTVRFYGTPAEEDGNGKVYMARAGFFNDLDVCLDWHPGDENEANLQSSLSISSYTISFHGKTAHAAADPWNGRSALDAAELFTTGLNFMREHIKPTVRMHYVYTSSGKVPNVVPEEASVWLWIRDTKRIGVAEVAERMKDVAKGAALMAGVDYKIELEGGIYERLVNEAGVKALYKNMELVGPITYTDEEIAFANKIMETYGLEQQGIKGEVSPMKGTKENESVGSTDVGDVSHIVPEITLSATTAPYKCPWHSWGVVACSGMSIGHKGMLFAAKSMAATMVDLFEDKALRDSIKAEFIKRKGNEVWEPMVPEGPAPIPETE